MAVISYEYGRYSISDKDRYLAGLEAAPGGREGREKGGGVAILSEADAAAFSTEAVALATGRSRPADELQGLAYEPLLSFPMEDGGNVLVEAAWDGEDAGQTCTALKITVTRADGEEEVIYLDYREAVTAPGEERATAEAETEETEEAVETAESAEQEAVDNASSLAAAMARHGLGQTDPEAGLRLLDIIRARVAAMEEASRETREVQEEHAARSAERAEKMAEMFGDEEGGSVPGEAAPRRAGSGVWTYTRRGLGSTALTEVRSTGYRRSL